MFLESALSERGLASRTRRGQSPLVQEKEVENVEFSYVKF